MDQHRDVPATDGWGDAISDGQEERAQLRTRVNELHKIMDRLHALQPEYQKLIKTAQQSLRAAHLLEAR